MLSENEIVEIRKIFSKFIVKLIKDSSIDFKRKMFSVENKEINIDNYNETSLFQIEWNDDVFSMDKIKAENIENVFDKDSAYYSIVKKLSKLQKEIFYKEAFEDKKINEIARELNTSENTISSIKSQIKKKFKNLGGQDYG